MGTGLTGSGRAMGPKMHITAVIRAATVIWAVVSPIFPKSSVFSI